MGLSINDVTQFWCKIEPHPTSRHMSLTPPLHILPQKSDPPPQSQENELPIGSSCHCLKPKYLPVVLFYKCQNHKKECAKFRPIGNSNNRLPCTHSSVAGEFPNCSMRGLASPAQNHTGCINTLVTSWYFKLSFHPLSHMIA